MRTRIPVKHDPLFAVGLIAHRRERRPLRAFARALARRLKGAGRPAAPWPARAFDRVA